MKKFFSLLTLALLTLSVGAATNTYSYTFGSKTFSADGTVTLNNVEWTLATVTEATDGGYFGYDGTKGQQFGSGSKPCSEVTLSTSGISGTITKVTVNASTGSQATATMEVTVGGDSFISADLTSTATNYSGTGSATGEVVIKLEQPSTSKALYIKSIEIDYEGEPVSVAAPVFTPNGGKFSGSQEVTITCADGPCNIYYSEGTELDWTNHTYYNAPFYVTETKTFTAVAEKGGIMSEPTTVTFTKVDPAPAYTFLPANYDEVENKKFSIEKDGVTFECSQGTITGEQFRIFKSQTATFTAGEGIADIVKIEFTCTANGTAKEGPGCLALNEGQNGLYTYETDGNMGTWTGKAASISFNTNANQVRATKIVFTLDDGTTVYVADPILPEECEFDDKMTITITAEEGATINYALNDGDYTEYTVPFTIDETTTIKAYAEYEGIRSNVVSATYTKKEAANNIATIAEGNVLENNTEFTFTGKAVVCFKNKKNMWIRDESGSVQVYGSANFGDEFAKGVVITPNWSAKKATFNGMPEYTDLQNFTASEETQEVLPFEREALTVADNGNEYVIIKGVNIVSTSVSNGKNNYVTNTGITVRDNYEIGFTLENNGIYNFTGIVSAYQGNAQLYMTEYEKVGELTVTVEAPVLSPKDNTKFVNSQEVTITCPTEGATIYYSTDGESYEQYEAPFTINETCTVKAYAELNGVKSTIVSAKYIKLVEVNNIAAANALDNKVDFIFHGNVVVAYQNGPNLWIRDASGSGLIYGNQVPTFAQGTVLNKEWTAQKYNFRGGLVPEFQYPNDVTASNETETIEPFERETLTNANVNEYVILRGQTITAETDETISNYEKYFYNADGLVLYNQFGVDMSTIEEGKTYDVEGTVTVYNEKPQLYIIKVTEAAAGLVGDVDEDGNVNITDVTALIDMLLSDNTKPSGDVNGDGQINITDVTDLIDILLKN